LPYCCTVDVGICEKEYSTLVEKKGHGSRIDYLYMIYLGKILWEGVYWKGSVIKRDEEYILVN
jgi:hypothetical protein